MLNIHIPHDQFLGDTILPEPAITFWAQKNKTKARLFVENEFHRVMYEHHPYIDLVDVKMSNCWVPSCGVAFEVAHRMRSFFGAGYFSQLGLSVSSGVRLVPRLWGLADNPKISRVCIASHARSCGSLRGERRNIRPLSQFWEPIVEWCGSQGIEVFDIGGRDDVPLNGTTPLRLGNLREVAQIIKDSEVLIAVETGILSMVGSAVKNLIRLSSATPTWFLGFEKERLVRHEDPNKLDPRCVVGHLQEIFHVISESGIVGVEEEGNRTAPP